MYALSIQTATHLIVNNWINNRSHEFLLTLRSLSLITDDLEITSFQGLFGWSGSKGLITKEKFLVVGEIFVFA